MSSTSVASNYNETSQILPLHLWIGAVLIASQSFQIGYIFSCLNSCLLTGQNHVGSDCYNRVDPTCPIGTIYNDIDLSIGEVQLATSLALLGAWIGCFIGSSNPAELYGRKQTLIINNTFFIVGAVLSCGGKFELFVGRFLSGLGVGVASVVAPVLLSEIATVQTRGKITTLHQVMLTFAILFAALFSYGLVLYLEHGWKYVQGFATIPSIIMIILRRYVPDSPKWLIMKGLSTPIFPGFHNYETGNDFSYDTNEAAAPAMIESGKMLSSSSKSLVKFELEKLRTSRPDVDYEIQEIILDISQDESGDVNWSEVLSYKTGLFLGCFIMLFQSSTGINSVVFYSTTIFGLAGVSNAILGTTYFGVINFVCTILAAYLVDILGRKLLLFVGYVIMLVSLIVLSSVLVSDIFGPDNQGYVAVGAVLTYVVGYAIGPGAVSWVILSEVMPTRLRMKAVSIFLSLNWICNLVIGFVTLSAIKYFGGVRTGMTSSDLILAQKRGVSNVYFIFAAITSLAIMFVGIYLPETKGKSPEEITAEAGSTQIREPGMMIGESSKDNAGLLKRKPVNNYSSI